MSKKSVPNSSSYFWNPQWFEQDEYNFLKYAHNRKDYRHSSWLYTLGRDLNCLRMTLEEFQANLRGRRWRLDQDLDRNNWKRRFWHKHRNDLSWYNDHGVYYREPQKFQKKQPLTHEVQVCNADWREKKGFERDYRNKKKGKAGWRKVFKTNNARVHRRRESQNIFREDWDFTPYKRCEDPWGWD